MSQFNSFDEKRHTAIYVRISTASQKTDRQQEELTSYAELNQLNFNRNLDVFIDVVSGFKDGVDRPNFSVLKTKIELGVYQQVLFSEFSRLDRKPSNLLKDLEWFQAHDCLAYFHKQNLWVGDKSDIGTQIMIQVLAVMSQYEIELFTSRGIDGKISAIKNRKTTCGGFSPYGYRISEDSRLVINEDEAAVVRRIFSMYLHGEKTVNIKDTLNSEKIPCPYKARQDATNQRRKNKGLGPVEYKRGAIENMLWRRTTIARILRNKVYIGIQTHTFHEPDPANPIPRAKRKGRKVIEKFEIQTPETRIISDEEFYQVDKTFAERMYNRNQGIRRPTMIKDLLRCGECGSHFCAVLKFLGRAYECAAKAGRINVKCLLGPCVLMSKLDGLVLRLCIQKFAQYDLVKKSEGKIRELEVAIAERSRVYDGYVANQKEATEVYSKQVQRAVKYAISDSEADALVKEAKEEYDKKISEYSGSMERLRNELADLSKRKRSLMEIRDEKKLMLKMDAEWWSVIPRLNGKIILIMGNHDMRNANQDFMSCFEHVTQQMTISVEGQTIVMNHNPFLCFGGAYRGVWQLFGHVHSGPRSLGNGKDDARLAHLFPTQYDVGVDNNEYRPVSYCRLREITKDQLQGFNMR